MSESYWQREARWCDRWHDAAIPPRVEFAVLGGGLSGLSTAIRLRELHPGADIVLLEAERVGYGASGRNAGFLSPLAAPVWLLGAERAPDQAWAATRINEDVHATARWLAETMPASEICAARLSIDATGRLSDCGLSEFAHALERIGLAHQLTESRARPGHVSLAMDAYTVHPYKLVRGLAEHAVRAGVQLRERARVRAVEAAPGGARVRLDGGAEVVARKVIVCTNAYTSSLELGERMRAAVIHSFMLASAPLDRTALEKLVRGGDFTVELDTDQVFHRMHADRLLYGGIDKLLAPTGGDFAVPDRVRARLVTHLRDSFPGIDGITATEAWAGRFHATASGLPIIRPSATNPAVILNVGYGGTGVALALVCARLAAAVASDRPAANRDDARLLAIIQGTRISVRDSVRTIGRLVRGLAHPARAFRS